MKVIILIGPAGAGKSTFHKKNYPHAIVCSSDDYFTTSDGHYHYDPARIGTAQARCLMKFADIVNHAQIGPITLVVDNTNTTLIQIAPYVALALAYDLDVACYAFADVDPETAHQRNVHNVPLRTIFTMWFQMKQVLKDWPPYWPRPIFVNDFASEDK